MPPLTDYNLYKGNDNIRVSYEPTDGRTKPEPLPVIEEPLPVIEEPLPVLAAAAPLPVIEENQLVVDLFKMLDADSNDDIHMNAAENKCRDWVPSKMTQQTSDTYWEILNGTEDRYGCLFINAANRCVVGYEEVERYIEDEGYWQSPDDLEWYKDTNIDPSVLPEVPSLISITDTTAFRGALNDDWNLYNDENNGRP